MMNRERERESSREQTTDDFIDLNICAFVIRRKKKSLPRQRTSKIHFVRFVLIAFDMLSSYDSHRFLHTFIRPSVRSLCLLHEHRNVQNSNSMIIIPFRFSIYRSPTKSTGERHSVHYIDIDTHCICQWKQIAWLHCLPFVNQQYLPFIDGDDACSRSWNAEQSFPLPTDHAQCRCLFSFAADINGCCIACVLVSTQTKKLRNPFQCRVWNSSIRCARVEIRALPTSSRLWMVPMTAISIQHPPKQTQTQRPNHRLLLVIRLNSMRPYRRTHKFMRNQRQITWAKS